MRKQVRVLMLVALIAAIAVPVGFALSRETDVVPMTSTLPGATIVASTMKSATPILVTGEGANETTLPSIPDGAKLLFVGTMLFGVAAVVRRAA